MLQRLPGGLLDARLREARGRFHEAEKCIACGACVLQCPEDAIELK